jgi:hypothetical protein
MEGTFARVGFAHDIVRGDEVWNASQVWYLPIDNFNEAVTDEIGALWIWRDWYYVINISNFVITRCEEYAAEHELNDQWKRIKGQALFTRALGYYNLAGYYQNPTLILDYNQYQTLEGLQSANWEEGDTDGNAQYDRVMDQVEKDFAEAMTLLPSRDEGGEWANGRATSGAAAGFYARALMMRHKYSEALAVLKDILNSSEGGNKKYGSYKLMENYGDNFQQGTKYENFLHDYAEENGQALADAIRFMKEQGYPAQILEKEELHMLLSAYLTAVFEPIIHGLEDERIEKYLTRVNDFFMPSWKNILGVS